MKNITLTTCGMLFMLLIVSPAIAQHGHHHDHEASPEAGSLALELDEGERWATDASLRQGMADIREAFQAHHQDYRNDRFDQKSAAELADQVSDQVDFMFANCQLSSQADAELHKLLAAALDAVASLRDAETEPYEGLHALHQVLDVYPQYFDHPGWI